MIKSNPLFSTGRHDKICLEGLGKNFITYDETDNLSGTEE